MSLFFLGVTPVSLTWCDYYDFVFLFFSPFSLLSSPCQTVFRFTFCMVDFNKSHPSHNSRHFGNFKIYNLVTLKISFLFVDDKIWFVTLIHSLKVAFCLFMWHLNWDYVYGIYVMMVLMALLLNYIPPQRALERMQCKCNLLSYVIRRTNIVPLKAAKQWKKTRDSLFWWPSEIVCTNDEGNYQR